MLYYKRFDEVLESARCPVPTSQMALVLLTLGISAENENLQV